MIEFGKNFYMVTETNLGLGEVPEIWARAYETRKEAIDGVIDYLDETEQFYEREDDIDGIKEELEEDGFAFFGNEELCFTVQQIGL